VNYKVEIKDNNTIEVFDLDNPNENNAPFLRQDVHPDGRAWESREEAQSWIDSILIEWAKPAEEPAEEPAEVVEHITE
jgi:hypothetical protein